MSLNKFTDDSERKEWMLINCKSVSSETSNVDKYSELKQGSVTAPPANSVRLYNRSGDNLAYVKSSGETDILAVAPVNTIFTPSVYFSQVEPQTVPSVAGVYGASLLDSVTSGKGSLTLPANAFANEASYELTVSGIFSIDTNPKLINFGLFLDGSLHRDGKSTASLPVASGEAFTAHIYLSCRDQGDGTAIVFPSGKITVSGGGNLSVSPMTGPGGTFGTPVTINAQHTLNFRSIWTSANADFITTEYASLVRTA